ncbi:MAG: methionyl-tRNA formyltransferase [bacterium]|nr:methionyl-tRNA formyltransferase [bacterium]
MESSKRNKDSRIVFWGTSSFSIGVLEALKENGFIPDLIVTAPDKPRGRKLIVTPPPVKIWAQENKIPFIQPEILNDSFIADFKNFTNLMNLKLAVVASYGKIIPKSILDIPKHGTLNIHPSLLPKLRGASPIQSAILTEDKTGVTIMLIDEKMDHGPIVAQKEITISPWPPKASVLEPMLAHEGGKLLAEIIPGWVSKKITAREQEHDIATYTKKFTKEDGLIDLTGDPMMNFRKIQAFDVWPKAYFFTERHGKKIRVTIIDAELVEEKLVIKKVLPEGKREMQYEDFLRGI